MRVLVWLVEDTWPAAVDAALAMAPDGAELALVHVHPTDLDEVTHGARHGLFGRGHGEADPGDRVETIAAAAEEELLAEAATRAGRPVQRLRRRGRVEREVVAAAATADLLVAVRDGDPGRLGPKSLGRAARFVVDHAPCPVLLVWPGPAPAVDTIPPHPVSPGDPGGHGPA